MVGQINTTWTDIYDGEKVIIHRETNDVSLQHDRYACAVKRIKDGRGLLVDVPQLATVGHIPLEVSKHCHYFMCHGGEINGVVEDSRHRLSPIPSGGLEIKLKLTFKGLGDIVYKMKQLIRESYSWEYTGEQRETERVEPDPLEEDEEIDL